MSGVPDLAGLALAAVRRAPHRPLGLRAHRVAAAPELGGDAGVRRVPEHRRALPVLDLPPDLRAELEVQSPVVDRPRAVGVHVDAVVGVGDEVLEGPRGAGHDRDVRHPDEGEARPAVRAHRPIRHGPHRRGGLARHEIADEDPVLHRPARGRGHALVVVAEGPEAALAGRVDRDVHVLAAVAERAEPIGREERRPRERGLGAERAIELDRMAAALVALEHELVRAEDHGGADVLRALLGGEQRHGLVGDAGRVLHEVPLERVLPARGVLAAAARSGVRADLLLAVADGLGGDRRAGLVERLRDVRALARDEQLLLAPDLVRRARGAQRRLSLRHRRGGIEEELRPVLERQLPWVDLDRGRIRRGHGLHIGEARLSALRERGRARDLDRERRDAVGLVGGEDRGCGEAPRAVRDRAHREAEQIRSVDVLEMAVLHLDILDGATHEARIGVRRAARASGVERPVGKVPFDGTEHQVRTR